MKKIKEPRKKEKEGWSNGSLTGIWAADILHTAENTQSTVEQHSKTFAVHSFLAASILCGHFPMAEAFAHLFIMLVVKDTMLRNKECITLEGTN